MMALRVVIRFPLLQDAALRMPLHDGLIYGLAPHLADITRHYKKKRPANVAGRSRICNKT